MYTLYLFNPLRARVAILLQSPLGRSIFRRGEYTTWVTTVLYFTG